MTTGQLPIRWKLTAWYATLLAFTIVVSSSAIYFGLRHELFDNLNEQLDAETGLIAGTIVIENGSPVLHWSEPSDPYEEQFARLVSVSGDLVFDSAGLPSSPATDRQIVASVGSGTGNRDSVNRSGTTFRTRTIPVIDGSTIVGALQVGHSTKDLEDIFRTVRRAFWIVLPLVLIMAISGGYLLSGRALRPVRTITELAREIDEGDLESRLNLALPDDELGQLATTFNAMLDRIEQAFDRQRRFAADAAHELRTPVSLMRSRVDVALTRDRPADHYRSELVHLQRDLERLSDLASALLSVARADAGHLAPRISAFDVATTITAVVDQYTSIANPGDAHIGTSTEPTVVDADEDLMIQVLVNLLDNARAYTPTSGSIEVGCRRSPEMALIWIEDTGPGIPAEYRERVFDRFFRVDSGRNRASGGAGLGLSISRSLVQAQGGRIAAVQPSGSGSRIEILLPLAPDSAP